jgi:DNA-binding MarR family transcriptional regulator
MRSSHTMRKATDNPRRSEEQTAVIHSMLAGLDPFFRLRPTIPARCVQAFFLVAEKEGLAINEYAKRGDLSPITMSRNLIDMGERDRNHEEGPGLVESHENIMNRRETLYRLTPKGRALLAAITRALNPEVTSPEKRIARMKSREEKRTL